MVYHTRMWGYSHFTRTRVNNAMGVLKNTLHIPKHRLPQPPMKVRVRHLSAPHIH